MNARVKLRLVALAAAMALMGLSVVFLTVKSQRHAGQLRERLSQLDSESFRIADEFRTHLRELNNILYRYGSDHAAADLDQFTKASDELNNWIDLQKPKLHTAQEKELMQQIDTEYDQYLLAANELQSRLSAAGRQSAAVADYTSLMRESQKLFDIGQSLAKAHFESRAVVLSQANETVSELRTLVMVSLSALFLFAVVLAAVVYRDMIAPLRVKLVESQAVLERQEKLASLGLLAAGVAHEIRNPLTAIKAALFIQQKRFHPGTPEFEDVRLVEREILRLEKIVSDFLLFARPAEPNLQIIPAQATLREVQDLLAPQLARKDIKIVLADPPAELRIKADAGQIKQVLINLVQNAADAIGQHGVIRLLLRRDRMRTGRGDASAVVLEVADNGQGIPPEVQARLFDPFFTTRETGTGLGLSIAAGIVQKHGGALQYQTQLASGTTFGIILPEAHE